MKKAIMYGAGNIGRGFIGQQFSEAGYEVIFVDIDLTIVNQMNEAHGYPLKIVSEKSMQDVWVDNVSAINGRDNEEVANSIIDADIMATAVGVNVLPRIIVPIAEGLRRRWNNKNYEPLNILLCENLMDADKYMKKLLVECFDKSEQNMFEKYVGLVQTSIGRMVPVMTKERQEGNILSIWVEPYCKLPVDKKAFKGDLPRMKNLVPYSPFEFYIEKKLFIHNMGHALTAYLGQLSKYEFICDAIKDPYIKFIVLKAMQESAIALSKKYTCDMYELLKHVDDLIYRFANPHLGDTIYRVGKDPLRKLAPKDRLFGAANCCLDEGIEASYIGLGITAALFFDDPEDEMFIEMKKHLDKEGIRNTLWEYFNIEKNSMLASDIEYFYMKVQQNELKLDKNELLLVLISDCEYKCIS